MSRLITQTTVAFEQIYRVIRCRQMPLPDRPTCGSVSASSRGVRIEIEVRGGGARITYLELSEKFIGTPPEKSADLRSRPLIQVAHPRTERHSQLTT